jgi:hypothetical protein
VDTNKIGLARVIHLDLPDHGQMSLVGAEGPDGLVRLAVGPILRQAPVAR